MHPDILYALVDKIVRHVESVIGELDTDTVNGVTTEYREVANAVAAALVEEQVTLEPSAPLWTEMSVTAAPL